MEEEDFIDAIVGPSRNGRGMARKSLEMIEHMHAISKAANPITGRGVGYKLFTQGLIRSMGTNDMQTVYRLLKLAREKGHIPWHWIVDENRTLEKVSAWDDPADFARTVAVAYRRDFWNQQPVRVEVWSEKGTVRGVLRPVLDEYGVGFRVMHGFGSAAVVHDISQSDDEKPLHILYVGDYDPSGLFMSEVDLENRFDKYGGDHIRLKRVALTKSQTRGLPHFSVHDKKKDKRYKWFRGNYGDRCWELDAMDPNDLRDCVEQAIESLIEPKAWARCVTVNKAEQESLRTILDGWTARE